MRIFGGLLPFVGFREEKVDEELRAFLGLPPDVKKLNTFQLAWLGTSICFPIYPDEKEGE